MLYAYLAVLLLPYNKQPFDEEIIKMPLERNCKNLIESLKDEWYLVLRKQDTLFE
jgi:hypothetical protein